MMHGFAQQPHQFTGWRFVKDDGVGHAGFRAGVCEGFRLAAERAIRESPYGEVLGGGAPPS